MQRTLSRKLFLLTTIIVVGLLATLAFAQDGEVVVPEGDEVTIGFAAALTGEGLAPLGIDIQRGVELAQEDRPTVSVGGVEFPVGVDAQDSLCSAEGGQTVANRFVSDESIVGVVGHMCSSSCEAAAPIYDAAGYTNISPSCTSPTLTLSGFTSFNRAVTSDAFQGVLAADFIVNELGITSVATVHDGSPYGEGLVTVLTSRLEELGAEVVAADAINVGDTDFRALLEEFATEEPELIYFGGFPAEAARLIQQRADAGLEDVPFMGADGIQGTEVIDLSGDAAEGVYASAPVAASSEALDAFLERYIETYGEEPPAPFHANGYDAYNILLDGIEAVGEVNEDGELVISRAALAEYVRSFSDFQGLTGVLNADGTGETSTSAIGFFQVQEGEFVELMVVGGPEEEMMEEEAMEEMGTIVDIASASEDFETLVELVVEAELVELLSGEGPFTVFAPTDDAFDALPEGLLDTVRSSPISLQSILAYHVVSGAVMEEQVATLDGESVATLLEGASLEISVTDDGVFLNGTVQVTMTDIVAANGVIHVIDGVLIPDRPE